MIDNAGGRGNRWLDIGIGLFWLVAMMVLLVKGAPRWPATIMLLAAVVTCAWFVIRADRGVEPTLIETPEPWWKRLREKPQRRTPLWLLVPALLAMAATANMARDLGQPGVTNASVVRFWVPGMVLLLLAAWWFELVDLGHRVLRLTAASRSTRGRPLPDIRGADHGERSIKSGAGNLLRLPAIRWWGSWAAMIAVAAAPRFYRLDRFPTIIDGDGGTFMSTSMQWQREGIPNLFGISFFGNPTMWNVAEGWLAGLTGSDLVAFRSWSALIGTVSVLATWRLGRYLVGPRAASCGAIILAVMPMHLHFSRMGLNNISDPAALVLAMLFLIRAIVNNRRGDAVITGFALGFGFYGYFGGRVFPVVVLVVLAGLTMSIPRLHMINAIRLGFWIAAGFVATTMPLLVFFSEVPAEFGGRLNQTSSITLRGLVDDPRSVLSVFLPNLRDVLLYPLISSNEGHFRRLSPFLGWVMVVLLAVGVVTWMVRLARDREVAPIACLLAPWALMGAGVALTWPVSSQRLLVVTPYWALAAGSGVVFLSRWLGTLPLPRAVVVPPRFASIGAGPVIAVVALMVLSVQQLTWVASEDRQITNYSDYRTMTAWDIGWRLSHGDEGDSQPFLLFAGAPMMYGGGWGNLRFQVPDLQYADVLDPIEVGASVPALERDSVLVIISERSAERCAAEEIFGDAMVAEVHARDGTLLYLMLYYEQMSGWSTATTPAGTTLKEASASACDGESASVPAVSVNPGFR